MSDGRKFDVPPIDLDLASAAGGEWFIEHMKESAAHIFLTATELHPMAVVVARRHPKTRMTVKRPIFVPVGMASDQPGYRGFHEAKGALMAEVRRIAKRLNALAAGTMAEAWSAPTLAQTEYRKDWRGRLDTHPERVEVLFVAWQHRVTGVGGAMCEVLRGTGRPSLGGWSPVPLDGGLMVEILPEGEQ